MELHERVRHLRLEAGMTQNELAGDKITRNMLSQIENGNATPSIQTLMYIAERLNTSAAYFLSDDEDDFLFKKAEVIAAIKTKLKNKEYNTCIQLCSVFVGKEDDELNLILAECFFYAATDDFKSGRLSSAHNGFLTSQKYAALTSYTSDWLVSAASSYINLINTVNIKNDTALANASNITSLKNFTSELPHSDTLFYYDALILTETGSSSIINNEEFIKIINDSDYKKHIAARLAINKGNRGEAFRLLGELDHDDTIGAVRYHVIRDLERLYTQIGDFENAYNFSRKRINLYIKMQE
ncbi:MAG: helix-turn-helix domain-containing protein [Eubacteriales bacterium]